MSSWHYAFYFPGTGQQLKPASAITTMAENGLEFDNAIRPAVVIDADGHLDFGEEVELRGSVEKLCDRLLKHEQFLVECRNSDLFFACSFATEYCNPYMAFGWPRRLFRELSRLKQDKYWNMLRRIAKQCNANFVAILNDPPDYFEDRFLEIDGQRFLETTMPSGNKYDMVALWIDAQSSDQMPHGVDGVPTPVDGFIEFAAF